jgi:ribosomal protein RSM22 (predicted rRNA methylase)
METEVLWTHGDFVISNHYTEADLILFSYSFGEIDERNDDVVLENCFRHAKKFIVLIEPGTPRGYKRILKARKKLIELGAYTLAPCPHDHMCPLSGDDWCHFSTRIERTALQRVLKQGSLGYEDEKYSYIIMGKKPKMQLTKRVLTEPMVLKEKVTLKLCTEEGLIYQDIPRKEADIYKKAKKIKNGDHY